MTRAYGSPHVLVTRDFPTPSIAAWEILVEVHAGGVTAGDIRLRTADFPGVSAVIGRLMFGIFGPRRPIQGTTFAGRVVQVGAQVTKFAVGDDVFGSVDGGAYAQYLQISADGAVAKTPGRLSGDEAAAIPYGAGTALHFLKEIAELLPGEKVLVLGASGGVGRFAVQIAKHLGAEVTAVCGRAGFSMVRELGADHLIDHRCEDFTRNGQRYDVILDIADASSFAHSRSSLTQSGRYLTLYVSVRVLAQMAWTGLRGGPRALFSVAVPGQEQMRALGELATQGLLRPVMAESYTLEKIALAHAAVESGDLHANVVVRPCAAVASC